MKSLTSDLMGADQPAAPGYRPVGFDAVLAGSARRFGGRPALADGDLSLTFAELDDLTSRFATGLRDAGVRPRDRVALAMANSLWYAVAYHGILRAGATACAVNQLQPPAVLRDQLTAFGATALVTSPDCTAVAEACPAGVRTRVLVEPTATNPAVDAGAFPGALRMRDLLAAPPWTGPAADPEAVAHLQLTGGTTGRSKGVQVLQRNIVANTIQCCAWRHGARVVQDADGAVHLEHAGPAAERLGESVMLQVAPFYHGAGLVGLSASLLAGTTTVFHGRFDPQRYLASVAAHRVTRIGGTPALFHALLAVADPASYDLSSVTTIFSGTAPISTTTLAALGELFPRARVTQGYGLSEATCYTAMQSALPDDGDRLGGVGRPLPGTTVEIRDDAGRALGVGEVGEIFVSGPQVTAGYFEAEDLTREQFRDGWLRTGDLGHLDERGELFISGRAKDMLIYKGYNVYPQQLEELLAQHPAVGRAAVVGRPVDEVGQVPVAFVVPAPDPTPGSTGELAADLMAFVATRVAPYQKVREVHFVDELPLTDIGKVAKPRLVALLAD